MNELIQDELILELLYHAQAYKDGTIDKEELTGVLEEILL